MKDKSILIGLFILIILITGCVFQNKSDECEKFSIYECKDPCGVCPNSEVSSIMGCHMKEFCGEGCLKATSKNCTSYTHCEYDKNTFGVCIDRTCFIPCSVESDIQE